MVRAAAKNFHSVAVVTDPERYGFLLDELRAGGGDAVGARRAAIWRPRRSRTPPATTRPSRHGSRTPSRSPSRRARPGQGRRPDATARTRTSAPPSTSRPARAGTCCRWIEQLGGRALSFNNLGDLNAARAAGRRVPGAGLRDRQARQPLRRRGRRDGRGGVREGAGGRPAVRLRRRDRGQPAGRRGAGAERCTSSSSRCCSRPGTTTPALEVLRAEGRACGSSRTASGARRARASATSAACWAACWSRTATRSSTTATR